MCRTPAALVACEPLAELPERAGKPSMCTHQLWSLKATGVDPDQLIVPPRATWSGSAEVAPGASGPLAVSRTFPFGWWEVACPLQPPASVTPTGVGRCAAPDASPTGAASATSTAAPETRAPTTRVLPGAVARGALHRADGTGSRLPIPRPEVLFTWSPVLAGSPVFAGSPVLAGSPVPARPVTRHQELRATRPQRDGWERRSRRARSESQSSVRPGGLAGHADGPCGETDRPAARRDRSCRLPPGARRRFSSPPPHPEMEVAGGVGCLPGNPLARALPRRHADQPHRPPSSVPPHTGDGAKSACWNRPIENPPEISRRPRVHRRARQSGRRSGSHGVARPCATRRATEQGSAPISPAQPPSGTAQTWIRDARKQEARGDHARSPRAPDVALPWPALSGHAIQQLPAPAMILSTRGGQRPPPINSQIVRRPCHAAHYARSILHQHWKLQDRPGFRGAAVDESRVRPCAGRG